MCFISPSSFSSFFSAPFSVVVNRPFLSCLKPLFQSQAKCEVIVMKIFFIIILIQIKLIFTTEVLPLASFCKWEVLELGNGVFLSVSSRCFSPLMILFSFAGSSYISSSAGRNDSGTFFLRCYACILYQRRLRGVCGCGVVSYEETWWSLILG